MPLTNSAFHHQGTPDRLTAAWLQEVIRQGKGARIEFKSSFQKEVIETLRAFANTQGGMVSGQAIGVCIQAETIQGWINQCKQITSPRVIPDIELVQMDNNTVAVVSA